MKKNLFLLSFTFFLSQYGYSQNSRTPIDISNEFYTIKISEGISPLKGSRVSVEKKENNSFNIENASLKTILERVFPNSTLKFVDNKFAEELLNVTLTFRGISFEEFQPLFIQQISKYFPIKIVDLKGILEKWTFQKQDSVLLSKKFSVVKFMDVPSNKINSMVTYSSDGDFKAQKVSLDGFAKNLSQQIKIPIENKIESKGVYDFELKISNPIDYEDIKKQLEGFGFQIVTEKYNNKVLEISTK